MLPQSRRFSSKLFANQMFDVKHLLNLQRSQAINLSFPLLTGDTKCTLRPQLGISQDFV